jgi:hypothetical protein
MRLPTDLLTDASGYYLEDWHARSREPTESRTYVQPNGAVRYGTKTAAGERRSGMFADSVVSPRPTYR